MNKSQKIIKIFAICLAIAIIVNIFHGILYIFSSFIDLDISSEVRNFEETYKDVENLKIITLALSVDIKVGEEFKVVGTKVKSEFSSKLVENTLIIEENNKSWINNAYNGNVIVYIPKDYKLNNLDIDIGAGKVNIDSVLANNFKIKQGAGMVRMSNSSFNKTNIKGGAGKIAILSSLLNDLDLEAGVGEVDINASITGNSEIECGVGSMKIKLSGNVDDYAIFAKKGIGNIKIDNIEQKSDTTYGTGINSIKIEGGVGSIFVDYVK